MTAAEAVTITWQILKVSNVPTLVTPNIFKYERPLNFTGECIVVNSLPMTGSQFQKGYINVNHFVPNLVNNTVNPVDRSQPNSARLDAGAKVIEPLLTDLYHGDQYLHIEESHTYSEDDRNEWFNNFRVLFKNVNL